ncbi:MAG TPA: HD domain-containing protein, partial [Candidatus Nanoarchaeia archaeon]|nr:HD domain-containing protein [Candidatus Nanoarchaeia archaeon]
MDVNFLIKKIKEYNKETDVKLIKRSFDFSEKAHEGNKRDSGDPYFIHPYNVALILTTIKADDKMICAALLHDVAEDTKYKIEDI